MDLVGLIKERRSIRQFTSEGPPREVIRECLEAASWAPNPTSQQPWKFIVLQGDKLKEVAGVIRENFAEAFEKKEKIAPPPLSEEAAKTLEERKGKALTAMMSTLQEKGVDMQSLGEGNFTFHGAPVGVIFATYPWKDQNFLKSTVAAVENFLLAASAKGLGTCWMNAISICQDSIKKALDLPQELVLVDGVAVGYPAKDSPVNQLPRERLPVDAVTEWL
jgi:nitroreductase